MPEPSGHALLASKLCPWLNEPLERCDAAIAGGRLGHAWLIHGVAGIGKLNLAFALAQRLQSDMERGALPPISPAELAGAMSARHEAQNHHPDLHCIFPEEEGAAIGIDQIRAVIEVLTLKSFAGSAKVVIIEPADAMTVAAANSLLKTLEQPSDHSYLLLVSDRPGRLPATIRSRCQRLPVRRPMPAEVAAWLRAGAAENFAAVAGLVERHPPLAIARLLEADEPAAEAAYAQELQRIGSGQGDPIAIADAWAKRDPGHALDWLVRRLQLAIRERSLTRGSTSITETASAGRHTAREEGTSLRFAFEQLDAAEALRNQLGGGINAQLALRVLLLRFRPEREST